MKEMKEYRIIIEIETTAENKDELLARLEDLILRALEKGLYSVKELKNPHNCKHDRVGFCGYGFAWCLDCGEQLINE